MFGVAAIALSTAWVPALAGPEDDTLNLGWAWVLPSYDVYYNQSVAEGGMLGRLLWDTLIDRDLVTREYRPLLATDWRWIDPLTLEFDLRQGVKFHDGTDFTADDVVSTVEYVLNPESRITISNMVSWIKSAEKIHDYKVRLHLVSPRPAALEYVASTLVIYPTEYYAAAGPKGMSEKPVGTGPYVFVEGAPGQHITLERNPNYFEGGSKGQPKIGRIKQRTIAESQTLVAELLSGRLDWIWQVAPDMTDMLETHPDIKVMKAESFRFSYVTLDAAGRSSEPLGNLLVRQALNHAIDREAIATHLMPGTKVISQNCIPIQFGCPTEGMTTYDFDPEKAKALLVEAGYPNGFDVDFYAYRDRPVTEAIMGDLANVGVRANLNYMTFPPMYEKKLKWETPMVHSTTGSWSIADVAVPLSVTFQGGPPDMANDAELTAIIVEAASTIDQEKRKELYHQAYKRITDQAYMVPLTTDVVNYAMNKKLDFTPSIDEVARFDQAKWAD